MTYEIRIARSALKVLASIERRDQQRIRAAIDLLADNPRPPACTPLVGESGVYRIRIGDYRVLYEVRDAVLVVHVVAVGHRRDVYR